MWKICRRTTEALSLIHIWKLRNVIDVIKRQVEFVAVEGALAAERIDVPNAVTGANNRRSAARRPGQPDSRSNIVKVGVDQMRVRIHARKQYGPGGRIEIGQTVMHLARVWHDVVARTDIHGQSGRNLEIVLRIRCV